MITSLLRHTNLGQLRSLVSPAFFDVVPRRMLWAEGRRLLGNYRDPQGFGEARASALAGLADGAIEVTLVDAGSADQPLPDTPDRYARRVVSLYFHQLFHDGATVLDLRASAFRDEPQSLAWHPASMWTVWEPAFLDAIREVYLGYYGDDDARFRRGLAALDLEEAAPLFRAHFGDPTATRFELDAFVTNFHAVFVHCRDRGVTLPGDFLALGVYLACMYENLDRLDVTLDARRCFETAVGP